MNSLFEDSLGTLGIQSELRSVPSLFQYLLGWVSQGGNAPDVQSKSLTVITAEGISKAPYLFLFLVCLRHLKYDQKSRNI